MNSRKYEKVEKPTISALRNPYDLMAFPEVDTSVVTYEYTPPAHEAAGQSIFGGTMPANHLPVTIQEVSLKKAHPPCIVDKYGSQLHLDAVAELWSDEFGTDWPLTADKIGKALYYFRKQEHTELMLGSTYLRFFPVFPGEREKNQGFFERRGWKLLSHKVWDLSSDLDQPLQASEISVKERTRRENIWFERHKAKSALSDFQDYLIARQGNENGKWLGSLILNTTHVTYEDRCDLIWMDERLFTEAIGGMACFGIASEERGRGIVATANEILGTA
ncbi:hypothetical protein BJV82DRAFT_668870 [Fennellomyces sp. T-0311]|nr:hypothetical protein BJV82DRAFT_668870 [Fennellomyces sp. T-0311]